MCNKKKLIGRDLPSLQLRLRNLRREPASNPLLSVCELPLSESRANQVDDSDEEDLKPM
jgi:hypothetical protein